MEVSDGHSSPSAHPLYLWNTNTVDFRKGCYLGQELTIRTFHTGITRKRILPIQLFETEAEALSSFNANNNSTPLLDISTNLKLPAHLSDIRPVNLASSTPIGRPIGKFYSGIHNIGLALLRLDAAVPTTTQSNSNASSSDQHKIVAQVDGGLWLRAFRPTQWWPQNINTESTHLTL